MQANFTSYLVIWSEFLRNVFHKKCLLLKFSSSAIFLVIPPISRTSVTPSYVHCWIHWEVSPFKNSTMYLKSHSPACISSVLIHFTLETDFTSENRFWNWEFCAECLLGNTLQRQTCQDVRKVGLDRGTIAKLCN